MDNLKLEFKPPADESTVVVPASGISNWGIAIKAGGLDTQDQATGQKVIRNADDIFANSSTRNTIERSDPGTGTTLRVRMRYQATDGVTPVPLIIRVFASEGITNGPETPFVALPNLQNECSVPIRTSLEDSTVGSGGSNMFAYTTPDNDQHSWDCDGYKFFIIGVEQVYGGTAIAEAWLEVKIV